MKKQLLTALLAATMLTAGAGVVTAVQASADDTKSAVTVQDVNYSPDWNMILVNTNTDCGVSSPWGAGDATHVKVTSPTGANIAVSSGTVVELGTYIYIGIGGAPEVGTVLTLEAGYSFSSTAEIKETVSYIYSTAGAQFEVFAPTALTAANETVSVIEGANTTVSFSTTPSYSVAPVTYSVAPEGIATVVGNGLSATITGVKEGTATLTATCGGQTATVAITVKTATQLSSISVSGSASAYQGATEFDLSGLSGKKIYSDGNEAEFTITSDMISGTYDLNTVGTYTLTVTCEEKTATFTLEVKEREALTVLDVNYVFPDGWGIMIRLSENSGVSVGNNSTFSDTAFLEIVDSTGKVITDQFNYNKHQDYIFASEKGSVGIFEIGSKVTVKKGFVWMEKEIKEDVTFIYCDGSTQLELYDSSKHDVTTLTITNDPEDNVVRIGAATKIGWQVNEGAATTPKFSSADTEIATVDASGNVVGVKVGTTTITVQAGAKTATYEVEVKPALNLKQLAFGTSYKIWVEKDGTLAIPSDFTAHAVFEEEGTGADVLGLDFALTADNSALGASDTSSTGTKTTTITVTYGEEEYPLEISYEVYEIVEMSIKEVAVVEWFSFNIFVEYPNSTLNGANMTTASLVPDASKFTYTRADGTEVQCGYYQLGMGNIAILPSFFDGNQTLENFAQAPYIMAGDIITLQAGLTGYLWTGDVGEGDNPVWGTGMIVKECVLSESVQYRFDGSVWGLFVPYTDVTVKSETIEVVIGKTVSAGAVRVPSNATEGEFAYESSNEAVATVTNRGVVTGVAAGEATITITLKNGAAGEKTVTVKVVVSDAVTGLAFAEGSALTVKKGTETLDLSGLSANLVYASGKTEAVDLSNAEIVGYDKDTVGESEVTVKVTVNGTVYQAQLSVTVTEETGSSGGCGSSVSGAAFALLLCLGAAVVCVPSAAKRKNK